MNSSYLLVSIVVVASVGGCASHSNQSEKNRDRRGERAADADAQILSTLHAKNLEEIRMGHLAERNSSRSETRQYGTMLVRDHTDADSNVRTIADKLGVRLSDLTESADARDPLTNVQGAEFDAAFARKMQQGHHELIQTLSAARGRVSDSRVKELLDALLPILQKHEDRAHQMVGTTGGRP